MSGNTFNGHIVAEAEISVKFQWAFISDRRITYSTFVSYHPSYMRGNWLVRALIVIRDVVLGKKQ